MLRVCGLGKSYGDVTALNGVTLDVAAGQLLGLLGRNGAGKTTLMSIIAGLVAPDRGTVSVCGFDPLRQSAEVRRRLGYTPQDLGVYPTLRVSDNLRYFGELAGLRGSRLRRAIDDAVSGLDLDGLMDKPVRVLSGGEQRRVHTAMALLGRPPVVLLDEPTAGVDVQTRSRILDTVQDLAASGSAVCYSTHYLAEIEQMNASVAILHGGRILAEGELAPLVSRHGLSALELRFQEAAGGLDDLPVAEQWKTERNGDVVRVYCAHPATELPTVLGALGPASIGLKSVNVMVPSLESTFLALTGEVHLPRDEV
jgi:ABC-2 type transport system ATP-binding protein